MGETEFERKKDTDFVNVDESRAIVNIPDIMKLEPAFKDNLWGGTKLRTVFGKKCDCVMVKAGTIHAIGAGILICEIQQNSNCTYRMYDYDRRDKFGNRRELHIDKAIDVVNVKKYNLFVSGNSDVPEGAEFDFWK